MQKWEEVHSDTRFSLALDLLERALRPETELDPNLSLLGRVGLEKLGDPGSCEARGLQIFRH